jgi:hypothetical protein
VRASATALAALLTAALLLVSVASAGRRSNSVVVARGHSLHGVPWRIRMKEEPPYMKGTPRSATLEFTIGKPDEYSEAGYFSGFSLPVPRSPVFSAIPGSEFDSYPEGDVSGYAARRVAKLVAKMSDGSRLVIEIQTAPTRLTERFHWLGGLRFFDQFYSASIEPIEILAYGHGGRLLERSPA